MLGILRFRVLVQLRRRLLDRLFIRMQRLLLNMRRIVLYGMQGVLLGLRRLFEWLRQ